MVVPPLSARTAAIRFCARPLRALRRETRQRSPAIHADPTADQAVPSVPKALPASPTKLPTKTPPTSLPPDTSGGRESEPARNRNCSTKTMSAEERRNTFSLTKTENALAIAVGTCSSNATFNQPSGTEFRRRRLLRLSGDLSRRELRRCSAVGWMAGKVRSNHPLTFRRQCALSHCLTQAATRCPQSIGAGAKADRTGVIRQSVQNVVEHGFVFSRVPVRSSKAHCAVRPSRRRATH
jgi:hypothetical protein